jgi:hypothetical protein
VPRQQQLLDHIKKGLALDAEALEERVVILDPLAFDRDERLASFLELRSILRGTARASFSYASRAGPTAYWTSLLIFNFLRRFDL